ncbi:MAG: hypothetical protein CMB53_03030 [Euryarchaeota archaeon]|nr:hypothetical protein [Euryarchaeota archaeon]|tara:strand:- start:5674 stop:6585 length:912 start_codon:yes stop_codon:yes gene_type:complete
MVLMRDLLMVAVILLCFTNPIVAQENNKSWSSDGGYTVLAEQFTAVWCEVCADVDPWMPEFTESNGNRVARVALHDDFDDPLGTPITDHRISRYSSEPPSAPSFWFDGEVLSGGAPDRSSIHRQLLSAEGSRSDDTHIRIEASVYSGDLHVETTLSDWSTLEQTQISIFIIEDFVVIEESEAINGVTRHHDVARAYHEVSINNQDDEWSFWGEFDLLSDGGISSSSSEIKLTIIASIPLGIEPNDLSIVAVHETIGESETHSTLGVLKLDLGEGPESSSISISLPLAIMMILSTISLKARSRR